MLSTDEREIARHATLGPDDMAAVAGKRGSANRLGYALELVYCGILGGRWRPA